MGETNENGKHYQYLIFMIFIWIILSNLYTKEYGGFTKQIERDWYKDQEIQLIGYDRKHELPPVIGSLFHLLQLMIIFTGTVLIYYIIELLSIDETSPNWRFEKNAAITNLTFTLIILIISVTAVWSMGLAPKALEK